MVDAFHFVTVGQCVPSRRLEAIISVAVIALCGSLTVPLAMLVLARLGYFEPIEFKLFGKVWRFAPKIRVVSSFSNATTGFFSRGAAVSGPMPAMLVLVANLQIVLPGEIAPLVGSRSTPITGINAAVCTRDVTCDPV